MASDIQVIKERLKNFTTYVDVFALALARSSKTHFRADTNSWASVMYKVCQEHKTRLPLLREVSFSERPPLAHQSDQVYELIAVLAKAGELSLPNPQFEHIAIDEPRKERIRNAIGDRLAEYNDVIGEITKIIEDPREGLASS